MITVIYAGESYGTQATYILEGPEVDLEALHVKFLASGFIIPSKYANYSLGQTATFVDWLIANHGYIQPDTQDIHTEN